ncbi:MAG TPA: hypothetical protein VII22_13945 [Streptosporangiaceae bacterium]
MALVHGRIYLAVAAWLLGAGAATGGSLVAVSLLGQSLAAPPTQQLTVGAVNRALASDSKQPAAAPTPGSSRGPGHGKARATAAASPSASAAAPSTAPASPSAAPGAAAGGTLLTSSGGSVVAACGSSGAYLISWSPQQGYLAEDVIRGPAPSARVTFLAGQSGVTMSVSCNASTPAATITTVRGDDGGSGE